MANPGIDELQNGQKYELIAKLDHQQIKKFVINQLTKGGKVVRVYMIYQGIMILMGIFFLTMSIVIAIQGNLQPLLFSGAALVFSFSLLIIIHELLHALALKITGARKINFGAYLKKFIFYAEADRHVLNRKQFAFIALTPLVVVKLVTLAGILLFIPTAGIYFFIFVMSAHSLFCAGDIGLLSIFYHEKDDEILTFDVKEEKTSYYYRKVV
jgi:hypothetical protein